MIYRELVRLDRSVLQSNLTWANVRTLSHHFVIENDEATLPLIASLRLECQNPAGDFALRSCRNVFFVFNDASACGLESRERKISMKQTRKQRLDNLVPMIFYPLDFESFSFFLCEYRLLFATKQIVCMQTAIAVSDLAASRDKHWYNRLRSYLFQFDFNIQTVAQVIYTHQFLTKTFVCTKALPFRLSVSLNAHQQQRNRHI